METVAVATLGEGLYPVVDAFRLKWLWWWSVVHLRRNHCSPSGTTTILLWIISIVKFCLRELYTRVIFLAMKPFRHTYYWNQVYSSHFRTRKYYNNSYLWWWGCFSCKRFFVPTYRPCFILSSLYIFSYPFSSIFLLISFRHPRQIYSPGLRRASLPLCFSSGSVYSWFQETFPIKIHNTSSNTKHCSMGNWAHKFTFFSHTGRKKILRLMLRVLLNSIVFFLNIVA